MKTVFLSDLHVDINKDYNVPGVFSAYLKAQNAALAVIAGDVSENQEETLRTLEEIEQRAGVRVLFVPGNHDLWGKTDGTDIRQIYARYEENEHCLCGKDAVFGELAFVGDAGWYDYSFGNSRYTSADFDRMELHGRTWQDKLRNDWTKDNIGRSEWMTDRLRRRMEALPGKRLVLVTHMLPVREFTVPEERPDWDYFNAFLGSEKLGELCVSQGVEISVCGHVHYRKSFRRDGVYWMCRCLNYESEWQRQEGELLREDICRRQVEEAAEVLEL